MRRFHQRRRRMINFIAFHHCRRRMINFIAFHHCRRRMIIFIAFHHCWPVSVDIIKAALRLIYIYCFITVGPLGRVSSMADRYGRNHQCRPVRVDIINVGPLGCKSSTSRGYQAYRWPFRSKRRLSRPLFFKYHTLK